MIQHKLVTRRGQARYYQILDGLEPKYQKLREAALEVHIPVPVFGVKLQVFEKPGGLLIASYKKECHSVNRNAYNWWYSQAACEEADDAGFGDGFLNIKGTAGAVVNTNAQPHLSQSVETAAGGYRGPTGDSTYGIVVGAGTLALSFDGFALQTQIVNGTGASQLSHVLGEIPVRTWTLGTRTMKNEWTRYFNNNSGGAVVVEETGIYARLASPYESTWGIALICRDLTGTVSVPNTGQLKVVYTISIVYP